MQELVALIGAISGIASLLTILYFAVAWKTSVDADRKAWKAIYEQYPPAETALMAKTLWDIYVTGALKNRPDLAEHHSAYRLKKEGHDLIPNDIKSDLDRLGPNPLNNEAIATGWLVVKFLGLDRVSKMAEQKGLSLQEAIAILSTYLDEKKQQA